MACDLLRKRIGNYDFNSELRLKLYIILELHEITT